MHHLDLETLTHRTREVAQSVIAANAEQIDRECSWPKAGINALLEAGLGGLVVPTTFGGHGQGLYALAKICEIIGRVCPSTAICFGMHSVGTSVIAANTNDYQIETFLKPIASGNHITTLSLSEPGSGVHFYLPQTRIQNASEDAFLANGVKTFVTNGGQADSYVISGVNTDDDLEEMSCFILPADCAGISWGDNWAGLGMRGNSSRTLTLNDVLINRNCLLGKEGDQIWYMFHVVAPWFLIAMAGTYLGIANEAFDVGLNHIKSRKHSHNNRALATVPLIQHRVAELWSNLQKTQQLIFNAAQLFDHNDASAVPLVLSSKADIAHTVVTMVNEIMTLCGGIGYSGHNKLGKMMRDARAAHVMSPTTDILRLWVGRMLLEQPILSDD